MALQPLVSDVLPSMKEGRREELRLANPVSLPTLANPVSLPTFANPVFLFLNSACGRIEFSYCAPQRTIIAAIFYV